MSEFWFLYIVCCASEKPTEMQFSVCCIFARYMHSHQCWKQSRVRTVGIVRKHLFFCQLSEGFLWKANETTVLLKFVSMLSVVFIHVANLKELSHCFGSCEREMGENCKCNMLHLSTRKTYLAKPRDLKHEELQFPTCSVLSQEWGFWLVWSSKN